MKLLTSALLLAIPLLADDFSTSAGILKITPIQHASFIIEAGGKVIYVDPAQGSYDSGPKADLTHERRVKTVREAAAFE